MEEKRDSIKKEGDVPAQSGSSALSEPKEQAVPQTLEEAQNGQTAPQSAQGGQAERVSVAAVQGVPRGPDLKYKDKKEVAKGGLLGFFIGLAVIVPGVSGSTVAIIFKLYDKLLYALGNLLKKFKKCVRFLLPIGVGAALGFVLGFFAVRGLLDVSPFTVIALFAGLMLGAYPAVSDEVKGEKKTAKNTLLFAAGLLLPVAVCLVSTFARTGERALEGLRLYHYLLFLALGCIVALTQIVPGLSATAVLMIAGYFKPVMDSVSFTYWSQNPQVFLVYACLGAGFLIGLVGFSKALTKVFERHRKTAFFCIAGLSLGSIVTMFFNPEIYSVYLSWSGGAPFALDLSLGIALFFIGAAVSYRLVRCQRKKSV